MLNENWNDPQINPNYCGYCKCEPCQCDGHGNFDDTQEVLEEIESDEEATLDDGSEETIEDYESPRQPRQLRQPTGRASYRPQRPGHA